MNTSIKIACLVIMILSFCNESSNAQYASRKISKKQQAYTDSLKQVEYNYIFPILGQQAYRQGFDIPYPAGLMANYDIWYAGLDPIRQGVVDNSSFPAFVDALYNAEGNTIMDYGFDKSPLEAWNMVIGGGFQLNKSWMLRSEVGILGDRKTLLV